MIKCMELAEDSGLKIAIFSLNAGTPEWNEMEAMANSGVFGRAKQGGHILALHEGVLWHDKPIDYMWGDSIPGAPHVEGAGPLHFRYRYLYHLLKQRGEVIPLFISEWYSSGYTATGETAESAVAKFRWCDEKYRQDYWVLGFCPFTLGPSNQWSREDFDFAYDAAVQYAISIKDEQNARPSALPQAHVEIAIEPSEPRAGETVQVAVTSNLDYETKTLQVTAPDGSAVAVATGPFSHSPGQYVWHWTFVPPTAGSYHIDFGAAGQGLAQSAVAVRAVAPSGTWGLPRTQYDRTYILLPPGAGREWVEAILDSGAWEQRRWTIGSSADDAGIGALEDKTVIAVNPQQWGDDLHDFFRQYYPRTRYVALQAATPTELQHKLHNM